MPSIPPACMRSAASAYFTTMRSMSQSSASLGTARWAGSRRGDGASDRQPVVLCPAGAPAEVGQLDHARRPVLVDLVAHAADPRHDGVVVGVQVAERRRAVLGDDGRAGGHRHADAALGLLDVVEPVAVLGHALLGVGGLVGGREDPIAQRQVAKLERLEQRVVAGGHRPQLLRSRRRPGDGARSARSAAGARAPRAARAGLARSRLGGFDGRPDDGCLDPEGQHRADHEPDGPVGPMGRGGGGAGVHASTEARRARPHMSRHYSFLCVVGT